MSHEYTTPPSTAARQREVIDRINQDWVDRLDKLRAANPHLGFFEIRHLMATREYGQETADHAYGTLRYPTNEPPNAPPA